MERVRLYRHRLMIPLMVPIALMAIGTVGYRIVEGPHWSHLDALYMTVITITTIGYGETHALSPAGRVFTMFLAFGGIFTLFYAAGELLRLIISGELRQAIGRRRMEKALLEIRDHYIVCGYGRMGHMVCREFEARKLRYVIIDRDGKEQAEFRSEFGIFMVGDATSDDVLRRAGVERAKSLVTVASSDADNLYIVLSARLLNERLFIVARAEEVGAEPKLRRVGANQVVSPYHIGGHRVAQAVLRPNVVDFIELATRTDHLEMQIEEVLLEPYSPLVGQTIADVKVNREIGVVVIAIRKRNGAMIPSPTDATILEAKDTLIVLGPRAKLDQFELIADPES